MATTKSKAADDTAADTSGGEQKIAVQHAEGDDTEAFFESPDPEADPPEPEKVAPHEGGWVTVTSGDDAGKRGYWVETVERDKDGVPSKILIRTRDADNQLLTVDYGDVERPVDYLGGR